MIVGWEADPPELSRFRDSLACSESGNPTLKPASWHIEHDCDTKRQLPRDVGAERCISDGQRNWPDPPDLRHAQDPNYSTDAEDDKCGDAVGQLLWIIPCGDVVGVAASEAQVLEEHDGEEWSEPVGDYVQEVFHDYLKVVAACNCGNL